MLPDGRRLGYADFGPADGKPIFYFHGAPSSRKEWRLFGQQIDTRAPGVRVIAVDRPGMGLSSFQPGRRYVDWPADVTALADRLGLTKFAVLGYSGGGPYAAVCARQIPERLTGVGMVSSPAPFTEPALLDGMNGDNLKFLFMNRDKPRLARAIWRMLGLVLRFAPGRFLSQAMAALPQPDRLVMDDPLVQQAFVDLIRESLRPGPAGPAVDNAIMVSPWGFDPAGIKAPVLLWHGDQDQNVPMAMARYLAAVIPHSSLVVCPGEGHVSLFLKHAPEILKAVAAAP